MPPRHYHEPSQGPPFTRMADEIPNDQKVVGKSKLADDRQFAFQSLHHHWSKLARGQHFVVPLVAFLKPLYTKLAQVLVRCLGLRHRIRRKMSLPSSRSISTRFAISCERATASSSPAKFWYISSGYEDRTGSLPSHPLNVGSEFPVLMQRSTSCVSASSLST